MRRLATLALAVAVLIAEEPVNIAYGSRPFLANDPVPSLDQNHLFFHEGPNRLSLYNTHNGERVYTASSRIRGSVGTHG
jgi:hypothetical protein